MARPKVSICIPAYKQVEYLQRTLASVRVQTFGDYEIIITDDSPDNAVEDCIKQFDFGPKAVYLKNKRRLGSPGNWNEAVANAKGEYIKMLHHDDWFTYPGSLQEYVDLLDKNQDVDFAFSAAHGYNVKENREWLHSANPKQLDRLKKDPRVLLLGNFIGPPSSTIYRSSCRLSYDVNLKWVVDFEFYIRILLGNRNFAFSPRPLITSASGAAHNVTNECVNNKEVELYEYLYLYNKVYSEKLLMKKEFYVFFKHLFKKYHVTLSDLINRDIKHMMPVPLYYLAMRS